MTPTYNVVITGATSGIGRAVALRFARIGASLVLIGRNEERGRQAVQEALHLGAQKATFLAADLALLADVQRVTETIQQTLPHLNILVHSVGIHCFQKKWTSEGIEQNFATNYLNKFALTQNLLSLLQANHPARIVIVGTPLVNPTRFLRLDGITPAHPIAPLLAFISSGVATGVWTATLAKRLAGTGISIHNVIPGLVRTGITRDWPWMVRQINNVAATFTGLSADEGAAAPFFLATASTPLGTFYKRMQPITVPASAYDERLQMQLWSASEELLQRSEGKRS